MVDSVKLCTVWYVNLKRWYRSVSDILKSRFSRHKASLIIEDPWCGRKNAKKTEEIFQRSSLKQDSKLSVFNMVQIKVRVKPGSIWGSAGWSCRSKDGHSALWTWFTGMLIWKQWTSVQRVAKVHRPKDCRIQPDYCHNIFNHQTKIYICSERLFL